MSDEEQYEIHVVPVNDLVGHEEALGCACGPDVETITHPEQGAGLLVIHHSLDGREAVE